MGFGGQAGFEAFLAKQAIDAVLDATHPFAAKITKRTALVCDNLGMPHAVVRRPQWEPEQGDCWQFVDREKEVAEFVPAGSTVFLGTGVQGLDGFSNLKNCRVFCRRIDEPEGPFPFAGGQFLVGHPPFSLEDEVSLFQSLKVDWLIVKNSGGKPSRSKLDAARVLGIKVALLNRPPTPDSFIVDSVDGAINWIKALV